MFWRRIIKIPNPALDGKKYNDPLVRDFLSREASGRCVYCAVHENRLGGRQVFHVDHYKPKSRDEFKALTNTLSNLYYACPICNRFKHDKWPNDPRDDHGIAAIPEPAQVNYSNLFVFDSSTGKIKGKYADSKYLEQALFLNRPQLNLERRFIYHSRREKELVAALHGMKDVLKEDGSDKAVELLCRSLDALTAIIDIKSRGEDIPYYEIADVTRKRGAC